MRYALHEIEVTAALPRIALAEGEAGVGLIVRRHDRPLGFILKPLPSLAELEPTDIARLLCEHFGTRLVEESVREELAPPRAPESLPSITAAVCTKDRPERLLRCLRSILALRSTSWGSRLALEILVVDNAPSDDRTRQTVALLSGVRYVREPRVGLDFARNRAMHEASGEILAFFDDDVTVDRMWLSGLVEALGDHPDAAAITGPVLPYELATRAQIILEQFGGFGHRFRRIRYGQTLPGNDLYPCGPGFLGAGCNMAFRRDVLLSMGGFDEALDTGAPLPGGGDLDILYRVIRGGHVLVTEPQCLVFHEHRRDYAKLRHQMYTWGLGFMAFVVKSYRTDPSQRAKFRRLVPWWFTVQFAGIVRYFLGRAKRPADLPLAEVVGGIVGLLGEYPRSQRRSERIRRACPS